MRSSYSVFQRNHGVATNTQIDRLLQFSHDPDSIGATFEGFEQPKLLHLSLI